MSRGQQRRMPVGPPGPHVSADELALFVIDALEPGACRRLERHVTMCGPCGAALAREAAAEVALQTAWPAVTAIPVEEERPLATVLPLRVSSPQVHPVVTKPIGGVTPAGAARARAAPVMVARAPAARTGARAVGSSSSWSSLAAAAMTLLFMGYWTDGGSMSGSAVHARGGLAALDAAMAAAMTSAPAICGGADPAGEGALCQPANDVVALSSGGPAAGVAACSVGGAPAASSPVAGFTPRGPSSGLDLGGPEATATGSGVCRAPRAGIGASQL